MRRDRIPDVLLAILLVAVLIGFGVMTWIVGGRNITSTAVAAVSRSGSTMPFDVAKAAIKGAQTELNLSFFAKNDWVTLKSGVRAVLNKKFFPDTDTDLTMVRLNDGLLAQLKTHLDVENCRDMLTQVKSYLDERGIPVVFTYMPTKVVKPAEQLPLGARDYANPIADRFIGILDDLNIDHLDARDTLLNSGMRTNQMFFVTDVHWTIQSAWAVYQELAAKLTEKYGFHYGEQYTNLDNFDVTTYEKHFLGSDGRDLGAVNVGLDDFTTILPKFDTSFHEGSVNMEGAWEYREGDFQTAVMHMEMLQNDEGKAYSSNCYNAYGYNRAEVRITNDLVDDGRILLIKNSAGIPITSFLSMGAHEVLALDWRLLTEATMAQRIEEFKPDVVIYVYNFDFLKPDRLNIFKINPNPGLN